MSRYLSSGSLISSLLWIVLSLFSLSTEASSPLTWDNNGHSYQRIENAVTWTEAKSYCESQGSYLATITSKEENDFISSQFGSTEIWLWLGGTDAGHEGTWSWVNGEPWVYSNWTGGEPNNYQDNNESSLMMYGYTIGTWNDALNDLNNWFVCESDSTSTPPPNNSSAHAINLAITAVSPSRYRLQGTLVDANNQPACGLALASGRCVFTCGPGSPRCEGGTDTLPFGQFDLTDLPTETNGTLNLQTFASGSMPGLQVVQSDGTAQLFNSGVSSASSGAINTSLSEASPGRYRLTGALVDANNQPACGLALASGRCVFTCGPGSPRCEGGTSSLPLGQFDLSDLPTEANGTLNLQTFVFGSLPGLQVIDSGSNGCSYAITPQSGQFSAQDGSGEVAVSTQDSCPWTAQSNASWIAVASESSNGNGPGIVKYLVLSNPGPDLRTGTLTIAGQQFAVSQSPPNNTQCTYAISPKNRQFSDQDGLGEVAVSTQNGCPWTAQSNADWIGITSGSGSGSGSGTVNYSVSSNRTSVSRTGTLTIAGQEFKVSQTPNNNCSDCGPG